MARRTTSPDRAPAFLGAPIVRPAPAAGGPPAPESSSAGGPKRPAAPMGRPAKSDPSAARPETVQQRWERKGAARQKAMPPGSLCDSLPEGPPAHKLLGMNAAPPHTGSAKPNPPESAVNRALILAFGPALCAVPALPVQAAPAPASAAAFKAPVAADGHPDLSGFWSNATLTPER